MVGVWMIELIINPKQANGDNLRKCLIDFQGGWLLIIKLLHPICQLVGYIGECASQIVN